MFILDAGAINNAAATGVTQKKDNVVGNAGGTKGPQKATVAKPGQSSSGVSGQKATLQKEFDKTKAEIEQYRGEHGQQTQTAQDKNNEANSLRSSALGDTGTPTEAKKDGAAEQAQSDQSQRDAKVQTALAQANQAQQEADLATQQAEVALGQQLQAESESAGQESEISDLGNKYAQANDKESRYEQEQSIIKKTQGGGDIA